MWGGLIHTSSTHRNIAEIEWHSRRLASRDGKSIGTNYQLMENFNLNKTSRYLQLISDVYVESMPASSQLAKVI